MWEAKVFAAAAGTNWKHKVTPDWSDLIMAINLILIMKGVRCEHTIYLRSVQVDGWVDEALGNSGVWRIAYFSACKIWPLNWYILWSCRQNLS